MAVLIWSGVILIALRVFSRQDPAEQPSAATILIFWRLISILLTATILHFSGTLYCGSIGPAMAALNLSSCWLRSPLKMIPGLSLTKIFSSNCDNRLRVAD